MKKDTERNIKEDEAAAAAAAAATAAPSAVTGEMEEIRRRVLL